jgi:alpha-tubulin suppressor-like RCC1 family protein
MPAATVTNNATGVLASGILSGATSLTLQSGQGARFPTITGTNYFWATLIDASNNIEIVKCTAHTAASDTFTITRAQQDTTAKAYLAGDRFEMRVTREHFNEKVSKAGDSVQGDLSVEGTLSTPNNPVAEHDVVNLGYLERYANNLLVDYTKPIFVTLWGLVFTATDGRTYALITANSFAVTEMPYFGSGGGRGGGAGLIRFPDYPHFAGSAKVNSYIQYSVAIDAAENITIGLTDDGRLIGTGLTGAGHWGLGNTTDLQEFRIIARPSDFGGNKIIKYQTNNGRRAIAEANTTIWLLTEDGSVWAAGEGATGALGRGSTIDSTTWIRTETSAGVPITNVADIYAPGFTTSPMILARKTDGTWWGLGDGPAGILGGGVVTDRTFWTQITELPTTAVRKVRFTGVNTDTAAFILFEDNTLWGAGVNGSGQQATGNLTRQTTYRQMASSVSEFWAGPDEGITNATVWIKTTAGVLETVGESNQYQTLMGNTTDKTTFSAATDIPSGFTLQQVWPLVAAETVFAAWQLWEDTSTGEQRIYAIGYANDGTLGTNNFAATTVNVNINDFLPVQPHEIAWMGGYHYTTATYKGLGWMVDTDGVLYASGRLQTANTTPSYSATNFPFSDGGASGGSEFFMPVPLYGAVGT